MLKLFRLCYLAAVVFNFRVYPSIATVIFSLYDGVIFERGATSSNPPGSSYAEGPYSGDKCPSNPCVYLHATNSDGSWVRWTIGFDVSLYNSLQISFDYYHNGKDTDSAKDCAFDFSCSGEPIDFVSLGHGSIMSYSQDMSVCAGVIGGASLDFRCSGASGSTNSGNLYIDNIVFEGTLAPTTQTPSRPPSKSPTKNPTAKSPSKSPTEPPSEMPSNPSQTPSEMPSQTPSEMPSKLPTKNPIDVAKNPTAAPTYKPTTPPITSAPSKEPIKAPSAQPTEVPTKNPAEPVCKTDLSGNGAWVHSDPRFFIWNGDNYQYAGSTAGEQWYYMHSCAGATKSDMPFSLYGAHNLRLNGQRATLDYVTVELYDDDGSEYILWFSSKIHEWMEMDAETKTEYKAGLNKGATELDLDLNVSQHIGNTFRVFIETLVDGEMYDKAGSGLSLQILIGDDCNLTLYMGPWKNDKYEGQCLLVRPPECYRCYACGLLGDFNTRSETKSIKDCEGNDFSWEGSEKWGNDGWSWKVSQDDFCQVSQDNRRRLQEYNDTNLDDEAIAVFCMTDEAMLETVLSECKAARATADVCCSDVIGGTFCDDLEAICYEDACILADGDIELIADTVLQIFTNIADFVCVIPDVGQLFDPADLIWLGISELDPLEPTFFEWMQEILEQFGIGYLAALVIVFGAISLICCVCIGCCCRCCKKKHKKEEEIATSVIEFA